MLSFKVKDLLIHLPTKAGGGGGTFMPNPDCDGTSVPLQLTPHTPILQVANLTPQFESAKSAVRRAFGENDRDGPAASAVAKAIEFRDASGSPALSVALNSAFKAVGGGIVQAAVAAGGGGGSTSLPGPDQETPPSPISPIAHGANLVLRSEHLAAIKQQLQSTLKAIEAAEVAVTPRSNADIGLVTAALEGAIKELKSANVK
jgi:hypothetical protein